MPINKKYSLKQNIDALKSYAMKTKTRITFDYVMLNELNDQDEDIKALARLMSTIPSKLNMIRGAQGTGGQAVRRSGG